MWLNPSRRGVALILVAGILVVLALLALSFAALAQLERRASTQRRDGVLAVLAARSGLEDALGRLAEGQDPARPETAYAGEDHDASGALDGGEASQEVFGPGQLNTADCPVRHALRPSFFTRPAGGPPQLVSSGGVSRGLSGRLPRASYALKVEDESGKIDVNGGFLDEGDRDADGIPDHRDADVRSVPDSNDTGRGWNFQLARILDLLGSRAEVNLGAGLGQRILAARPAGGYASMAQLKDLLGLSGDPSPWLTVVAWRDARVIHPNGFATWNGFDYQGQPAGPTNQIKRDRRPLALEEAGRAPVNLNAASIPVLIALLQGVTGYCWVDPSNGGLAAFSISKPMATGLAQALVARRQNQPFRTWAEFSVWIDGLVPSVIEGMSDYPFYGGNLCGADLVKANLDPNTRLNKNLPDHLLWRWIDKSDLVAWSTEGSLFPTGWFRLSSVGRVTDAQGALLAESGCEALVEAWKPLRHSTQQDFVGGRTLADMPRYLSLSTDPMLPSAGASAGNGWWAGSVHGGMGLAAMTYPCPPTAPPAVFDGQVGLATLEMPSFPPLGGTLRFVHHFDDGLDADLGTTLTRRTGFRDSMLRADPAASLWPDASDPDPEPGVLLPDGLHQQTERSPAYDLAGNIPGTSGPGDIPSYHGVMSYWVKPCLGLLGDVIEIGTEGPDNVFMGTGHSRDGWGICVSNGLAPSGDATYERQEFAPFGPYGTDTGECRHPGLRWRLVTAFWDTDEPMVADRDACLWVKDIRGNAPMTGDGLHMDYNEAFEPSHSVDITQNPLLALSLGGPSDLQQVIDELVICDFTDVASDALPLAAVWASERFRDGRYYKRDDAAFLSAPMGDVAGPPLRLLAAHWTAYLPSQAPPEIFTRGMSLDPAGTPPVSDPALTRPFPNDIRVEMALLDAAGGTVLRPLAQGGRLDLNLPGFRYRARFRVPLPDPDAEPVLETPFLDDVTFLVQVATGPRVHAWARP